MRECRSFTGRTDQLATDLPMTEVYGGIIKVGGLLLHPRASGHSLTGMEEVQLAKDRRSLLTK